MNQLYKAFLISVTAVVLFILTAPVIKAEAAVGSLTLEAGYCGGPYYERSVLSLGDMQSMSVTKEYSGITAGHQVKVISATGPYVSSVISKSEISSSAVRAFRIRTVDSGSAYFRDYSGGELFGTRYYYPNLADNYENGEALDEKAAAKGAKPVSAMLACTIDGGSVERFRLMLGQTSIRDQSFNLTAYTVHTIDMELTGEPEIKVKDFEKTLYKGKTYKAQVDVKAYDSRMEEAIKKDIKWSSSDPKVAQVDDSGNVTITGKGSVNITAEYQMKNKTVKDVLKISKAGGTGGDGNGGTGVGDGNGNGTNSGSGRGDVDGSKDGRDGKGRTAIKPGRKMDAKAARAIMKKAEKDSASGSGSTESVSVYEIASVEESKTKIEDKTNEKDPDSISAFLMAVFCGTLVLASITGRAVWFYRQIDR